MIYYLKWRFENKSFGKIILMETVISKKWLYNNRFFLVTRHGLFVSPHNKNMKRFFNKK